MSKRLLLLALFISGACSAQAGWACSSSTSPDPAPACSGPTYTPIDPAGQGQIRLGFVPFSAPKNRSAKELWQCDLAATDLFGAGGARNHLVNDLPKAPLAEREAVYKYFVYKAQEMKCHPQVRAWSACLALCVADVRFAKKAELDKLLNVRDFEKLPEFWRTRARRAYQFLVKQYALNQPAKNFVK